jgi:hypothetical protein
VLGAEACNGVDDDCDGATDEDFACRQGQTRACSTSCGVAGTETCASGSCTWGACCAAAEDCANTCDDDCDTVVNNGCCTVGDDCDCPAPVRPGGGRHTGTTVGMTGDFTTPSCGGSGSPDVVYALTLTESQLVLIDTNGSSFDTVLSLWSGATCPGTMLTCDDDSGEGARSFLMRTIGAGTYYIVVDGYGAADAGAYNLNVAIGSGDSCTAPRQMGGPGIYSSSTCGYNDNFRATSCGSTAPGEDIVYRLELTEPHTVVFDMCRGTTAFDSILYVRSSPCATGTQIGCNDDSTTCPASLSYLRLPLAAGTYFVIVDGYSGGCGMYELGVSYE